MKYTSLLKLSLLLLGISGITPCRTTDRECDDKEIKTLVYLGTSFRSYLQGKPSFKNGETTTHYLIQQRLLKNDPGSYAWCGNVTAQTSPGRLTFYIIPREGYTLNGQCYALKVTKGPRGHVTETQRTKTHYIKPCSCKALEESFAWASKVTKLAWLAKPSSTASTSSSASGSSSSNSSTAATLSDSTS